MQLDGGLCILLYCPIESHRIFLTSNCIFMHCSVPVNCPAVIFLPFMQCCLYKESTSSELWIPVQSLPLIHLPLLLVYFLQTITFHTIRLILCYSKPVSLATSLIRWGKVLSLCCAGLHVACNICVTFPSSYWFDNLGFLLRENLLHYCFTPCSWGSQQAHISCVVHHASNSPKPLLSNSVHHTYLLASFVIPCTFIVPCFLPNKMFDC